MLLNKGSFDKVRDPLIFVDIKLLYRKSNETNNFSKEEHIFWLEILSLLSQENTEEPILHY
jgi:hypothetical protein